MQVAVRACCLLLFKSAESQKTRFSNPKNWKNWEVKEQKQKGAEKVKNTLYFDADFNFLLLECEESDNNTIYINFHTSEAANQVLNISVDGGAVQTESLASDTDINLLLDGTYWANDGDTEIYLTNSEITSDPITITFPESISTSAALNVDGEDVFLFQAQQESGGSSSADKMGVVYYINGRPYTIRNDFLRIAQITFGVGQPTTALVACTFLADITGVEDTEILSIRLRINRNWEEFFTPKQTVKNGKYIITFTFPLPDCLPTDANIIDIYAQMSGGAAYIDQQQIKASVTASSLKSSGEWTGELEFQDFYTPFDIAALSLAEYTDDLDSDAYTPTAATFAESVNISLSGLNFGTLTDEASVELADE